eukprot:CAMPEP_0206226370 /NCGR_PEP_ID=MMETSP0047_2-20121206/8065_1 /ASSEMBLY_ACC=CAM_ASM_000192 /TAXON_ID=195065 /ORGANISM="Chroomonas mesostigmatica_cf, Strain CCMP1168" /LENGTH=92 /DNA_ID=CAMNT_0053649473 /DNA_START=213 /DNA_END=488 /DNA_ORIENTATION=-
MFAGLPWFMERQPKSQNVNFRKPAGSYLHRRVKRFSCALTRALMERSLKSRRLLTAPPISETDSSSVRAQQEAEAMLPPGLRADATRTPTGW